MNIEIDKNKEENILSSQNVIDKVLSCIGISRERTSTYTNYSFDGGELLRLRVSDHGLFLQYWYDKNREARMSGDNIPKLNVGQNLAITFSLTETECAERNIPYPQKIANKTAVKTEQGNNAKPQFTVRHICYFTDKLEESDLNSIINALKKTISDGSLFEEPIHNNQKVAEWNDTSNCPPQKVQGNKQNKKSNINKNMNKNRIKLTESQLHKVIKESVKRVLKENINNGYTQQNINNATTQWQTQGVQQMRQNNGGKNGYVVNQVGNNFHHSIPQENATKNATLLLNKAQYFYKYLMNNNIQSAMTLFGDIQGLVEDIYTNLEQCYQEQQNMQQVGGKSWQ